MVRFAVIADNHLYVGPPDDGKPPRVLTEGVRILETLVADLNALDLDFVVHMGDLTCGGGGFAMPYEAYVKSLDVAAQLLSDVNAPLHVVPGNHDCDPERGMFNAFENHWPLPRPMTLHNLTPDLRLAVANVYGSCVYDRQSGEWTNTLDAMLRAAADRPTILAVHTWILPHTYADSHDEPRLGLPRGVEQLTATLRDYPIIMALTGHRHRNRVGRCGNAVVIDTASLMAYPLGYRVIELHDGRAVGRFRQLNLPEVIERSRRLSDDAFNAQLLGTPADRDFDVER